MVMSRDFPHEVVFNPGLNAIIGSRSSGKSALLAYVAHAVDPDYAVAQQVATTGMRESDVGPGASITWTDVDNMNYTVEWAAPAADTGQVIYIPQNSLYAISERPDEITAKIQPAVFRRDLDFAVQYRKTMTDVESRNGSIGDGVTAWFSLNDDRDTLEDEIRGLGDRKAVVQQQTDLKKTIKALRKVSSLSEEEVALYQQVVGAIRSHDARLKEIEDERRDLAPYVTHDAKTGVYVATDQVAVAIGVTPDPVVVPEALGTKLRGLVEEARKPLLDGVKAILIDYNGALDSERAKLVDSSEKLRSENKDLIKKNVANVQIATLVEDLKSQDETLVEIDKKMAQSKAKSDEQAKMQEQISANMKARESLLQTLMDDFNKSGHALEKMTFAIEIGYNSELVDRVSEGFDKREKSPYIDARGRTDFTTALSGPGEFIGYMGAGKQKLKRGVEVVAQTQAVLAGTKELRFVASLEGDHIGGFRKSSMTPGKQALFALTLILAESDEPWPLLIDQPEDDLDSRSVCDVIVKDLMRRKCERQVIMVSHDANLVIGADSEEIIVANRHGDDRPNRDCTTFAYLTGSLEHSQPKDPTAAAILESLGIREHACEVLDGGAAAFQKRKDKYRI